MKIRDAIKLVEADGWRMVVQEGSHRQYKHPIKKGARYHCRAPFEGSRSGDEE